MPQVACGWRHSVAVTSAGHVYSWGRGASGQLGHGNTCEEMAPKRLELLDDILAEGPLQYAARNIVTPAANTIDNRCACLCCVHSL
jgi:alpha-tubulin suppressor-like RCC1 family protein